MIDIERTTARVMDGEPSLDYMTQTYGRETADRVYRALKGRNNDRRSLDTIVSDDRSAERLARLGGYCKVLFDYDLLSTDERPIAVDFLAARVATELSAGNYTVAASEAAEYRLLGGQVFWPEAQDREMFAALEATISSIKDKAQPSGDGYIFGISDFLYALRLSYGKSYLTSDAQIATHIHRLAQNVTQEITTPAAYKWFDHIHWPTDTDQVPLAAMARVLAAQRVHPRGDGVLIVD